MELYRTTKVRQSTICLVGLSLEDISQGKHMKIHQVLHEGKYKAGHKWITQVYITLTALMEQDFE